MCIKSNDDRFFSSLCFEKLRRGLWWEEMEEELCCVGCQSEDAEVEGEVGIIGGRGGGEERAMRGSGSGWSVEEEEEEGEGGD